MVLLLNTAAWAEGRGLAEPAKDCGAPDIDWVAIRYEAGEGLPIDEDFASALEGDLAAGLAARQVELCRVRESGPGPGAVAYIVVSRTGRDQLHVLVDARLSERLGSSERTLELGQVPMDGRAFAAALATDELLAATLLELMTVRRERAERASQAKPKSAAEPQAPQPKPEPATFLGLGAALEGSAGGQSFWGGDVGLYHTMGKLAVRLGAGVRRGFQVESESGRIDSRAFLADLALCYPAWTTAGATLGLCLGGRGGWARFSGDPRDSEAQTGSIEWRSLGSAYLGANGGVRVTGTVWVFAGAALGAPVKAVEIADGDDVATATTGVEASGRIGLYFRL